MNDRLQGAIGLIADSCCDLTDALKAKTGAQLVPLQVIVGDEQAYVDDGRADIRKLLHDMAQSRSGAKSACPSVEDYAARMRPFDSCFVITLSAKLSGSYNAARLAAQMVMEESPTKKIHVFDSKSASAGEVELLLALHDMIQQGLRFEEIVPVMKARILETRTLFVLQDFGNLIKNGRMGKVPGLIATALMIRPIMGEDGDGQIKLVAPCRGLKRAYTQLVDIIKTRTASAKDRTLRLVMSYCNCHEQALELKARILDQCAAICDIVTVPTGALSTMYASDGGIVVAFQEQP